MLLVFAACICGISYGISRMLDPLLPDYTWWKIFRRSVSITSLCTLVLFMRYVHRRPIRSLGLGPWQEGQGRVLQGLLMGVGGLCVLWAVYFTLGFMELSVTPNSAKLWRTVLG